MQEIKFRNRVVGILKNNVYVTHRNREHFFIKWQGFGISTDVLKKLRDKLCLKIMLIYTRVDGTQEVYTTTPAQFYEHGIVWIDEGKDYQRILPIKMWVKKQNENENKRFGDTV